MQKSNRIALFSILLFTLIIVAFAALFFIPTSAYFIKQNFVVPFKGRPAGEVNPQLNSSKQVFWDIFTTQDYEKIDPTIEIMTADYFKDPNDPEQSLLLGLTHYWKANERYRDKNFPATIIDSLMNANFYLEKSLEQRPADSRIYGWNGAALFSLGIGFRDQKLISKGYNSLLEGIRINPHYNYNAAAIVMSGLDRDNPYFKEAIDFFWKNIDVCIDQKIDRQNPDIAPFFPKTFPTNDYKFCWNTAKAPYSFEGRYLFMGDALVKNGQPEIAKKIYAFAKVSPTYKDWHFKNLLQERIDKADQYAQMYLSTEKEIREQIPFAKNSSYACVLCHVELHKKYEHKDY